MHFLVITEKDLQAKLEVMRLIEEKTERLDVCPSSHQPKIAYHDDPRRIAALCGQHEGSEADALRKLQVTLQLASLYAEQAALPAKVCRHRNPPITQQRQGARFRFGLCGHLNSYGIILINLLVFFVIFGIMFNMFLSVK